LTEPVDLIVIVFEPLWAKQRKSYWQVTSRHGSYPQAFVRTGLLGPTQSLFTGIKGMKKILNTIFVLSPLSFSSL